MPDVSSQISNGIYEVIDLIKGIVNPIAVVAIIVIGIYLVMGSNPQQINKAKTWGISIVIGLLIINLSDKIVSWLSTLGS